MSETVGQHSVAAFTSPVNGTSPIDANTVKGNDNTLRSAYVDHDADPGIHVQSSTLASRPVANSAGRKWMTQDSGVIRLFYDDGTSWYEVDYLRTTGGTISGNLAITGTLAVTGVATFTAQPILSSLTASRAVFTDASKGLVSNAITGTGDVVMSASPTLTGTITAASATLSGTLGVSGLLTFASLKGTGATTVTNILDEDNMASDSATALATQQSIKAYVDAQVGASDALSEVLAIGNTTGANDIIVSAGQKIRTPAVAAQDGSSAITIANTTGALTLATALADSNLATISTAGKVSNSATTATNANTASAIVARDASGNFSAGTITATLNGAAPAGSLTGTTLASNVVTSSLTAVGTIATGVWQGTAISDTYLATISTAGKVSNSATTATSANTASAIVARDASGNFTAGTITATLSGAAPAGSLSGTTLASNVVSSSLTSVGTLANLTVTNPISGSVTGSSGSTTGNAATATALQTARNINGVSFNGTADITVTAAAGTLTGTTLASGVTASSLTSVGTLSSLTVSGNTNIATTSGAVGVGLTNPGFWSGKFAIDGGNLALASGNRALFWNAAGTGLGSIQCTGVDVLSFQTGSSYTNRMSIDASGNLAVDTNTLYVDAANNRVGVGTASPSVPLEVLSGTANTVAGAPIAVVVGANAAITSEGSIFSVQSNTAMAADVGGSINLGGRSTTSSASAGAYAHIAGRKENGTSGNFAGYLQFGTSDSASDVTEKMRLDSSGNLGLGVTPKSWYNGYGIKAMELSGGSVFGVTNGLEMAGNAYYSSGDVWKRKNAAPATVYQMSSVHSWSVVPTGTADSTFTPTPAMTLDASGNLGVGTTSITGRVQVKGNASGGVFVTDSTDATATYGYLSVSHFTNGAFIGTYAGSNAAADILRLGTGGSERARITSGGDVLINKTSSDDTSAGFRFTTSNYASFVRSGGAPLYINRLTSDGDLLEFARDSSIKATLGITSNALTFGVNSSERARIESGGNMVLGRTSADPVSGNTGSTNFTVSGSANPTTAYPSYRLRNSDGSVSSYWYIDQGNGAVFGTSTNHYQGFYTNNTERARITSGGDVLVGTTNVNPAQSNTTGHALKAGGLAEHSNDSEIVLVVNRKTNDGTIVSIRQDGTEEGTISVSGNTVSYNAFAGSHWSQLEDGSKPEILRGTVMEAINELCEWSDETNERLPKAKVSDTAGSKKVYGVFMDWDNDWTVTNDMLITSVGAFICRVAANVVVEQGDLLESNGDGTARVQADDVIRSSTIGKVTSTVKTHQYDDGTYCVPTVLYCG